MESPYATLAYSVRSAVRLDLAEVGFLFPVPAHDVFGIHFFLALVGFGVPVIWWMTVAGFFTLG